MSSTKSYLLGEVKLPLDKVKKLSQYFQDVLTYDDNKNLVPKKGEDGKALKELTLNFSIFEEGNYGQNVAFTIPQTKEQREAGDKKIYLTNGKVYYASEDLQNFVQKNEKQESQVKETVEDDMPF